MCTDKNLTRFEFVYVLVITIVMIIDSPYEMS